MAHGSRELGPGPRAAAPMSHEPLTINNRLISELFDYILKVLGIQSFKCHDPLGGHTLIWSKTKILDDLFLTGIASRPKTIKLGGEIFTF